MEKQAIQHIEENAVAAGVAAYLRDISLPVMPLPANYSLVSLEKFMDAPTRFRGTYSTNYVGEFTAYLLKNAVHSSTSDMFINEEKNAEKMPATAGVFINAEKMTATAILDLGEPNHPEHGEHRAKVKLTALNAYNALRAINGVRKSQRDMAEWMEDWRDFLQAYPDLSEGTAKIDFKSAIAAVRNLTIKATAERDHTTQDFKATKSALETIEASSKGQALPGFLYFTCAPYEEIKTRTFVCRLGVLTDKEPAFVLRVAQMEAHIEEMGKEFQQLVQTPLLTTDIQVRLGEFDHA